MDPLDTHVTSEGARSAPPPWRARFLELLSEHGNVTLAASGASINRLTAYRERAKDATFAQQWELALELGADALEDAARSRALLTSDTLMIFLLKAHRPEKYREIREVRTVAITPEQAQQMSEAELEAELKRRGLL